MPNDGNPYEDNSTADSAAADRAALAEMRGEAEQEHTPTDDTLTVGDAIHDEDDGESVTLTGKAKKRARAREFREAKNREIEEARGESAKLREEMAEMRGHISAMQQQPQHQQPQSDPFEAEDQRIKAARKATLTQYEAAAQGYAQRNEQMPDAEREAFLGHNDEHNRQMATTAVRRELAARDTPQTRAEARLSAQYPDVMADEKARSYAFNIYQARRAAGQIKTGDDESAVAEVMEDTRKMFRMGKQGNPPASDRQQNSYGRMGRSSGGSAPKQGKNYTMSESDKTMALAAYESRGDWSDAQKFQAWVNAGSD